MSIVLLGSTSGSCTLQEQAVAGTTTLTLPTTSGTILTNSSAGTVLQVVSTAKTDTFTTTSTSFIDITGLSATITPTNSANKILVQINVNYGNSGGNMAGLRITRAGTAIAIGDAASSRTRSTLGNVQYNGVNNDRSSFGSMTFLDSPATTSATTYQVQGITDANTLTVNRSGADADAAAVYRTVSTITVMEIAA